MASMFCVPSGALLQGACVPPSCSLQLVSSFSLSAGRPGLPKLALPLLRSSSSSFAGNSSYVLQARHVFRAMRRSQPAMVNIIKAAFIFEWIGNLIRFFTKTPVKLFAQKLEADLDRAAKMIRTGASLVVEIAEETDEFAEKVERVAERTKEIAEKVAKATDTIEERVDDILDVIEGEKKVVITSYKLVDSESEVSVNSTTVSKEGDQTVVSIETSVVNESTPDNKPIGP